MYVFVDLKKVLAAREQTIDELRGREGLSEWRGLVLHTLRVPYYEFTPFSQGSEVANQIPLVESKIEQLPLV